MDEEAPEGMLTPRVSLSVTVSRREEPLVTNPWPDPPSGPEPDEDTSPPDEGVREGSPGWTQPTLFDE